jgi:hypothetical protein
MSNETLLTREFILGLLTDAEVEKVSRAEGDAGPIEGDEFIDLEVPGVGVQQAHGPSALRGHLLPRSAVSDATWEKIVRAVAQGGGKSRP